MRWTVRSTLRPLRLLVQSALAIALAAWAVPTATLPAAMRALRGSANSTREKRRGVEPVAPGDLTDLAPPDERIPLGAARGNPSLLRVGV